MQKNTQTGHGAPKPSAANVGAETAAPTADIPFPEELTRLQEISGKLATAVTQAEETVHKMDAEYMETKLYMAEYRGDVDPRELFQAEMALREIDNSGVWAVKSLEKLKKLQNSPYFARIDFQAENEPAPKSYYVGMFSFKQDRELLVFDWRAPVSSMFYDYELGPAGFTAPKGEVKGMLTRKRQFKIKNGKMEYALESSMNVQDDVLQRELSHTSDDKMKSIIATIQKEQNAIIRNENTGTLIIQGVAGSGKTSIALHRIAFLLYRFKNKLTAQNITILSPNKVFSDYISNVLPELGEEPIIEFSFSDIADIHLENVLDNLPEKSPLETDDDALAARTQLKSTLDFVKQMDAYIAEMPNWIFTPADYVFAPFVAPEDYIRERFHAYKRYPILKRLEIIAEDIYERFETENIREYPMPKMLNIRSGLKKMLKYKNTLAVYKDFFKKNGFSRLFVMPNRHTIEWNDVFPFLYMHAAFTGLPQSYRIKHLLIDEMQDYTPIQYAVINKMFACSKTILGDFGQFIHPNQLHSLEDLLELFPQAELVRLNKSYRSSYEIIDFAKKIQPVAEMDAVERHGEKPTVTACKDAREELEKIRAEIREFRKSRHSAMGIITRTNADAQALHEALADQPDIRFISLESTGFSNGISITGVQMAKGLEFDTVLVPGANKATYHTPYDRSLLYVACTRAMHKLSILYSGDKSPLLP